MPVFRFRFWLYFALVTCVAEPLRAQAPATPLHVAGESLGTARRFAAADKLAAEGKWAAAVNEYQQILDEVGDELVPIEPDHDVRARLLCHLRLSALPAEVLNHYRERIDGQARRWLAQGQANRDANLLRRIVDEAFVSRSTDQALDLLGELAFERGDFDTAEHWWRLIVRPASDAGPAPGAKFSDLVYPDPHVDVARVRAKQLLARLFRGDSAGVAGELEAYRKKHGAAAGDFAGHVGKFADTLQQLADSPTPLFPPARRWTTFGGTPARNLVLPAIPGRLARSFSPRRPLWHRNLVHNSHVRRDMEDPDNTPQIAAVTRRLVLEPVVTAGQVLVAEPRSVTAYDLHTGAQTWQYTLPEGDRTTRLGLTAPEDLRCTLTVAEDHIYARLGAPAIGPPSGDGDTPTYLLCLSMRSDPALGHYRWGQQSKKGEFFEGTPVVRGGNVYIAVTRFTNTTATTSLACYEATTGRPRWRHPVEICERRGKQPAERHRHHLLTLAGPNLVYCSHSGVVVALDAATGRRTWAVRYPSRGDTLPSDEAPPRDLCPCVFADGLIVAAPADYDRILCLDAATGQVMWRSTPVEVVQLLGVSRGRLFFTTLNDIRALELATGLTPHGWIQPDDGSTLPPFGRGFVTADRVFLPTENGLRVLRQEDGAPADEWYAFLAEEGPAARLGNLTFADDCLVVAGADDLTVYAPESVRLDTSRAQARAMPHSATAQYELALAQAAAGQDVAAWASFIRAGQLAGDKDRWQGQSLKAAIRASRQQLLLASATQAGEQHTWDKAAKLLKRAASLEFTTKERLAALARLARMWQAAGKPASAMAIWQSVLAEPGLADAAPVAVRAIDDLFCFFGPAVVADAEQQARTLLAASGAPSDAVLERVTRQFPNTAAAGSAWLSLARRQEQAGRWGEAAAAYRHAVIKQKGGAFTGLARSYEHERCWSAAQQAWRLVATRSPDSGERATAVARLRQPPYADSGPGGAEPLTASWETALASNEHLLPFSDPTNDRFGPPCFFTVRRHVLNCRDAATARLCWTHRLAEAPTWLGLDADIVLVAGRERVQALRLADGQALWDFVPALWVAASKLATFTHRPQLSEFRLRGDRLFFLHNGRELCAVATANGGLLWSVSAPGAAVRPAFPGGRFGTNYYADARSVVIQVSGGKLLILDSATGRRLHALSTTPGFWASAPQPCGEGRVVLAPDAQHIVLLDSAAGKVLWSAETELPTVTARVPQLVGDQASLLAVVDGSELTRLDAKTGTVLWTTLVGTGGVTATQVTVDHEAAYVAQARQLVAVSLLDGHRLWELPLPEAGGGWRLLQAHGTLLVSPRRARQEMDRPWLTSAYVPVFPLELAWRDVPLVLCHAGLNPGGLRLQMPARGPEVAVQAVAGGLVIGTVGRVRALQRQRSHAPASTSSGN